MLVGGGDDFVAVKEQRASGFEGEHGNFRGGARFDGADADTRNIEPEIVIRFCDFNDDATAFFAGEEAAASDAFVAAFKTFDGEDGAFFDDDGLADVEGGNGFGDLEAEGDVVLLVAVGGASSEVTGLRDLVAEEGARVEERDAVLGALVGDGAEDGLGVADFEPGGDGDHAEVEAEIFIEVCRRDAASHDGAGDVAFGEDVDEFVELADADPLDFVGGLGDIGVGLAFEGDGDGVESLLARGAGEEDGEFAVTCDDAEWFGHGTMVRRWRTRVAAARDAQGGCWFA